MPTPTPPAKPLTAIQPTPIKKRHAHLMVKPFADLKTLIEQKEK